jgi:formate--tetrahydrofolate ligase
MKFEPRPIADVAKELGISTDDYEVYGRGKAKLSLGLLERPARGKGRLVLVTAINPTPAGEGKTTTSIALAMGMRRLGKNAVLALREPSLGPVFGVKGGGTGGGKASLTPADDINLHFTGDIHAITTAHNLLSALVDNTVYFGDVIQEKGEIDPRQVTWGRAMDMNDRTLRRCIVGLGGKTHGTPREERFDITAASEIMAILALATSHEDLEKRLSRIVVGQTYDGKAVTAGDIHASAAMTAVLRDALMPNLVQTEEGGPAVVHCGPFGNIAHGCNSVLATRLAMSLGDYAITEAGFGFDLGGEKFLDIKCRQAGVWPRAVVLVATLRALKMHGGAPVKQCGEPDAERLKRGLEHLEKHLETAKAFGLTPIVAINVFPNDTQAEIEIVEKAAAAFGARLARSEGFARGGGRRRDRRVSARSALPLRDRRSRRREDPEGGARRLRREGRPLHRACGEEPAAHPRSRLRRAARLHGEDAALAHRRSRDLRSTARLLHHRSRSPPLGGRRLPRPAHRRDDDDAGPPEGPGVAQHQAAAFGKNQRPDAERLITPTADG